MNSSIDDLSSYSEAKPNIIRRILWSLVNRTLFRIFPVWVGYFPRSLLLKIFGCQMPFKVRIHPSVTIFDPSNLKIGFRSCIGPNVEIYNKAMVTIGDNTVVSQSSRLYTASHDTSSKLLPLITKPIDIGNWCWIAADVFIGPGVLIEEYSVVGACSVVFKNVPRNSVCVGNPAKFIKQRFLS
jgi:putative colanic acid biosynthesis acetyltransferase WcaF